MLFNVSQLIIPAGRPGSVRDLEDDLEARQRAQLLEQEEYLRQLKMGHGSNSALVGLCFRCECSQVKCVKCAVVVLTRII
jgi:hypothetical protein